MITSTKLYIALGLALALVAALIGVGAWCYDAGRTAERSTWNAKEAKEAQDLARQLDAEFKRGQAASAGYQAGLVSLNASYTQLEGAFHEVRRIPLLLRAAVPGAVPAVCTERVARPAAHDPTATPAPAVPPGAQHPDDRDRDHLSRAAVWMWNSALQGTDTPADTCGLADTTVQACAADTGLTLEDAWTNHTLNAKSCAADRLRYRALIEFLQESPVHE